MKQDPPFHYEELVFWFLIVVGYLSVFYMGLEIFSSDAFSEKENAKVKKVKELSSWKPVNAKVTAYVPKSESYGKFNDGKTANMDNAFILDGVAAPEKIPFETKIYIPGVGVKEVDDRGSAMNDSWENGVFHIDLRVKDKETAYNWGVKNQRVFIKASQTSK